MNHNEYKILLENMRTWYKTIGKVYCTYLDEYVAFNAKGFRHLRYDSSGTERSIEEQITRFDLLPFAIILIKQARQIHEYRISKDGKSSFWSFQGRVQNRNLRVVLTKKSGGNTIYISVMKAG